MDVDYVPQVIYWLDGYTWAGDPVYDADVEWVPVETDTIIIECKKDLSQKAADARRGWKSRENRLSLAKTRLFGCGRQGRPVRPSGIAP